MEKPSLQQIEEFVQELVLPFYEIERDMALPIHHRRHENDAEHSWSLGLVACALAHHIDPLLNVGIVSQLALVHDLVEIHSGDTSVWDTTGLQTKKQREAEALKILKTKCAYFPWIIETIEIYEKKETNEARYLSAFDKFLPFVIRRLDKGRGYIEKRLTKEQFDAGLVSNCQKGHIHPGAAEYYEAIRAVLDAHPEYFYQTP